MARIDFETVAHSYAAHPRGPQDYALKPLQFAFEDGGAYALLGPSGCGKTTLLNIISGLLRPSEGGCCSTGATSPALPPAQRNIAQVFQFPVIYDTMTVGENLAFPLAQPRRGAEAHRGADRRGRGDARPRAADEAPRRRG